MNQLAYSNGAACNNSDISCGNVQRINNACERFKLNSSKCVQRWVCLCWVPAENSLLRFASEDKTPGEDFLLGRSLSQNRRKTERGSSPTHYTLVPALQMEVSTSSSDSASLYHVSPTCPVVWNGPVLLFFSYHFAPLILRMLSLSLFHVFAGIWTFLTAVKVKEEEQRYEHLFKKFYLSAHMYSSREHEQVFAEDYVLTHLSVLPACCRLQLEVPCHQSVRGGFPAGTWVRGTVRAGCGKRRTQKPIFRRSGRSTGSS